MTGLAMTDLLLSDLLLTTSGTAGRALKLLPAIGALAGVTLLGGFILLRYRKTIFSSEESASDGPPLTLQDLRNLHRSGKLSDDEFERAKWVMIGKLGRRPAEGDTAPPKPGSVGLPGARVARPGYDLTGETLPKTDQILPDS
ncbi:MAG: hypothetical protein AAF108_04470 [Planctomycetota bacterium]